MDRDMLEYAESRDFGEVHIKIDKAVGLKAIIAIHSTQLGPALGGCRCIEYANTDEAIYDALRLARAMSFKSALLDLPHGGGKAVLIKPKVIKDREAYFRSYGRFVKQLGGQYITAVDSGSSAQDMDVVNQETEHVTSTTQTAADTSYYTALGVLRGIEAAVKYKFKRDQLSGLHVAIQGVGNVGYLLAKELHKLGVKLTVTDVSEEATKRCQDEFGADVVATNEIYAIDCDIFSPCALGSVINEMSLSQLKASIIAGSANNQLINYDFGQVVHDKGMLYAPDYVINAGGLIYAAGTYDGFDNAMINDRLASIYDSLINIFKRSEQENVPTSNIADALAQAKLDGAAKQDNAA